MNPKKKALKILGKRDKTVLEMKKLLQKSGFSEDEVDYTIKYLLDMGYLNDRHYLLKYVEMSMEKMRGPGRVISELEQKGLDRNVVLNYIDDVMDGVWERDTAHLIARKIEDDNPFLSRNKLVSKIVNKLNYEGFGADTISEIEEQYYSGN